MSARAEAVHLVAALEERLKSLLPPDVQLVDAHTHLGVDEDGMRLAPEDLLSELRRFGVARALVFPLHDPERHPAYRVPNDRVIDWAGRSDGLLVPFCRLDLGEDPISEARRALAAGAKGIKLHPRAQAFSLGDDRLAPVFALAEEERVPILIHAGRGMPPIGKDLALLTERYPGAVLILAHAAIVDQERIADECAGRPNVLFDTSTWGAIDLAALLARVAPEQVVYASDLPYGFTLGALTMISSLLLEFDADDDVRRAVLGGSVQTILDGGLPQLSSPIVSRSLEVEATHLRVYAYLAAAMPLLWLGQPESIGLLGLAHGACLADDELAPVAEMIGTADRLWQELVAHATDHPFFNEDARLVFRLLHAAQVASVTPRASARVLG